MGGDICAICCGTEREQTIHCPLDCEYLQESRRRERPPEIDPNQFPNKDIQVTEKFLEEREYLLIFLAVRLLEISLLTPNLVDADLKDALESLVRTHRTLQTGLYYESRPTNPLAGVVYDRLKASVEELRTRIAQDSSEAKIRDLDLLGVFAFLQRLEIQHNNGRRLGRAFIDFLRAQFGETYRAPEQDSAPLIV